MLWGRKRNLYTSASHLQPVSWRGVCSVTALLCFLASERHYSCVELDYGTWPIWATCLRHEILFFLTFIFERLKENTSREGAERGDTESEAGSRL